MIHEPQPFQLPISHWAPGDGHGTPLRRVDVPPTATPYVACLDCRRAFIPTAPDQRRCPRHQLEHDVAQSHRSVRVHGPDRPVSG